MKDIEKNIIQTILKHSDELLTENWQGIAQTLKEAADGKINVGLAVAIDWSEAAPKVKTVISYSRKWKDEREDELEDPNQTRLSFGGGVQVEVHLPDQAEEPPAVNGEAVVVLADPGSNGEAEPPKRKRRSRES